MTKKEIKEEISNFIKKFVPDDSRCILAISKYGRKKYKLFKFEFPELIERLYNEIDIWADGNDVEECQTVEGLWNYCKLTNGFGEICRLYYLDKNGNYINFGYGDVED